MQALPDHYLRTMGTLRNPSTGPRIREQFLVLIESKDWISMCSSSAPKFYPIGFTWTTDEFQQHTVDGVGVGVGVALGK